MDQYQQIVKNIVEVAKNQEYPDIGFFAFVGKEASESIVYPFKSQFIQNSYSIKYLDLFADYLPVQQIDGKTSKGENPLSTFFKDLDLIKKNGVQNIWHAYKNAYKAHQFEAKIDGTDKFALSKDDLDGKSIPVMKKYK